MKQSPFFAGDAMSVADIALYAYTHEARAGGFHLDAYPAVTAWLDRVRQIPAMCRSTGFHEAIPARMSAAVDWRDPDKKKAG